MDDKIGRLTSRGRLVIPANLRPRHALKAGAKIRFLEDQFGRIVLHPITEDYIDRVIGGLADVPDLLTEWKREHRREG